MSPLSADRSPVLGYSIVVLATVVLLGAALIALQWQSGRVTVEVFKTATCECCSKWVDHLRVNGFAVRTTDLQSLDDVKKKYSVPADFGSCHTAVVSGYVIEGHVPAREIQRLLKERPRIAGLAVPSMPAGAPGMEIPSGKVQAYRVLTFGPDGNSSVYAAYGASESPRR